VPVSTLGSGGRFFVLTCALLVAVAAALRIRAAQNDLWLDEIWSLSLAHNVSSLVGVLTSIHHDNNHYLNTLWMVLLPGRSNWWGYRLPSMVSGVATVIVAGLVGNRRGRVNAVILMLLTTFSYFLIVYSSEARGYSTAVFFALLSFFILDRFIKTPILWYAALFSCSVILGVLAHLTFVAFYLAMIVWSAYRLFIQRANLKWFIVNMLYCHALPMVFLLFLYLIDLRVLVVGGGRTEFSVMECFGQALTWAWGGEGQPAMVICIAVTAVLCLSYGMRAVFYRQHDISLGSDQHLSHIGIRARPFGPSHLRPFDRLLSRCERVVYVESVFFRTGGIQ
jgi:hypothetical protein